MAGWPPDPWRPNASQANDRPSGPPIELSDRNPSQILVERTQTSLERATESATQDAMDTNPRPGPFNRLRTWWSYTIRPTLSPDNPGHGDPRDYLALERTFLGWFRTSLALITLGVVVTQLFVLKDVDPKRGKILGAVMACGGIWVVLLGCVRYFRQQRLLIQGTALAGGWHHWGLIVVVSGVLMGLLVGVIVDG